MNFLQAHKSNYQAGRAMKVEYIVVHYTGNVGDTAKNNAEYFARTVTQTSAHYFVDEKEVWQSVKDTDTAWHCGGGLQGSGGHTYHGKCKNSNSIGVEMCSDKQNGKYVITAQTVDNAVSLVKQLAKKYGIDRNHVIRHYDVTGKNCPAPWVADESLFKAFLNRVFGATTDANQTGGVSTVTVELPILKKGKTGASVTTLQQLLTAKGFDTKGVDGSFGPNTDTALRNYQKAAKLVVDGSCGQATWTALLTK